MEQNKELIELISELENHLNINDTESLQLILRLIGENRFLLNEENVALTEALDSLLLTCLGLIERTPDIEENKNQSQVNCNCQVPFTEENNPADNFFNNFIAIHMGETMLQLQN